MLSTRVPLAVLLLGVVGCASVRPVSEPALFIPQAKPDVVVVIYKDNAQVPVAQPRISGDTLKGTWLGLGEPVAIPLSHVQRIDARQRSRGRTTFLIVGLAALTAGGVYAIAQATQSGSSFDCSYQPPTVPRDPRCG